MSEQAAAPAPRDSFEKTLLSVVVVLVAAGVIGLWQMSISVARLEDRLAHWVEGNNKLFASIAEQNRDMARRIEAIERQLPLPPPSRELPPGQNNRWALPPYDPSGRRQ
jgi:uncharacterized membrane protein YccC